MNILLYCDEYCLRYKGNYYLESFGHLLIYRYLSVFESVRVPLRVKDVSSKEELGKYSNIVNDNRIEIIAVPYGIGAMDFIKHFFKIRKSIKGICDGIDTAILRLPSIYSFEILSVVRKCNIPYSVEIVFDCYDGFLSSNSLVGKLSMLWMHFKQKDACKHAIAMSCVTEKYLQNRYFNNRIINSSYSSIELPSDFYYKARQFPIKKRYKIVHIAYQVAFNSRKGHNQLIDALVKVKKKGMNATISFVGGDYMNGIQKLKKYSAEKGVEDSVEFCGFLSRLDLRDLLISSDIAVLPTKAEGLPRVVIESMAMGLPCISSNVSGNPELLDQNCLFEYDDINGLADAIYSILSNPQLYESLSRNNFERSWKYEAKNLNHRRNMFYTEIKKKVNKLKKNEII